MLSPPMRTPCPSFAPAKARKVLVSASATLLISFLIAFHAVLLWQRVLDFSLFRPVPAIRWLATVALLVALYRLHRRGVSLFRGRGAVVAWLLVLLLHVSFWGPLADPSSTSDGWGGPGLLLVLPAVTTVLGLVSPWIRRILTRILRDAEFRDLPFVATLDDSQSYVVRAGLLPALACRPPPAS